MAVLSGFCNRVKRVIHNEDTVPEFFASYLDRIMLSVNVRTNLHTRVNNKRLLREMRDVITKDKDAYQIKDVKLPLLKTLEYEQFFLTAVFRDTFWSYVYSEDKYDEDTFNYWDDMFQSKGLYAEGLYGLVNDKVNVTVEAGDIVIDAGAWIGDFSAYASVKGALVYAFEPTTAIFKLLKKTEKFNRNIIPINLGLSDDETEMTLFVDTEGSSLANTLRGKVNERMISTSSVQTVRLDDFVREHNLPRVDFIKADIEGFERHMLAGAQETLARFAPKLALCTYHLPDDPEVMASLILKANPKYNIVQKRMKLFASVPE